MKKKEEIVYEKIEIEKKSNEPKIVDVPINKIEDDFSNKESENTYSELSEENLKSQGKQLVMKKIFGDSDTEKTTSKKQAIFKKVCYFLLVSFVLVVLGYTVYQDFFSGAELPSYETVYVTLKSNWFYLVFAFLALFFCFFFKAFKLSFLCKTKTHKWFFKTCFGTAILGHYYNYITPLAVGGQPFEIYYLSKHGVHGGVAASLPIATFFMQQFAFVILSIISLILYNSNALNIPADMCFISPVLFGMAILGIFCCFFVPFLVLIFSVFPSLGGKIVYFVIWLGSKFGLVKDKDQLNKKMTKNIFQNSKCLKQFMTNPFIFLFTLLISFAENLALCSIAYFTLRFFGYDLPTVNGFIEWVQVCIICMLLYSLISFIPTPGNSGAADISFKLLFSSGLAASFKVISPALLTWRFISFYSFIIVGFLFTKISKRIEKRRGKLLWNMIF